MADFLDAYSVQYWLESAPQGYLLETEYGHAPGAKEPDLILEDSLLGDDIQVWERRALDTVCGAGRLISPHEQCAHLLVVTAEDFAAQLDVVKKVLGKLGCTSPEEPDAAAFQLRLPEARKLFGPDRAPAGTESVFSRREP